MNYWCNQWKYIRNIKLSNQKKKYKQFIIHIWQYCDITSSINIHLCLSLHTKNELRFEYFSFFYMFLSLTFNESANKSKYYSLFIRLTIRFQQGISTIRLFNTQHSFFSVMARNNKCVFRIRTWVAFVFYRWVFIAIATKPRWLYDPAIIPYKTFSCFTSLQWNEWNFPATQRISFQFISVYVLPSLFKM